jgi:hypothetical protein
MTSWRLRILFALICLVTCATSASAECAWVLWYEESSQRLMLGQSTRNNPEWNFVAAYQYENACREQLNLKIKTASAPEDKTIVKVEGNVVTRRQEWKSPNPDAGKPGAFGPQPAETFNFIFWTARFICLPDTVDPRGTKGK